MTQTVEDVAKNASQIAISASSAAELARNGGAVVDHLHGDAGNRTDSESFGWHHTGLAPGQDRLAKSST